MADEQHKQQEAAAAAHPPEQALPVDEVGSHNSNNNNNKKKKRTKPFVYAVALTASLGALVFGFSLTGAGGTFVMEGFREQFGWTCPANAADCTPKTPAQVSADQSLITALQSVGSIFGAMFNPFVIDRIGRRWTIFGAASVFSVGAAIQCSAPVIAALCVGRFVGGFGVGMMAMSIPVYIAECSPSHKRGQLTTFWQFGVTIGMLIGTAVNLGASDVSWGWRISYGGPIVFALLLMAAMATIMPESPRYVAAKEHHEDDEEGQQAERSELRKVLQQLRYEDDIQHSVEAIDEEMRQERELGVASWSEMFSGGSDNKILQRVMLGMAMQFLNQMSGNESINFYAPVILDRIFSDSQSLLSSFILGIINLVAVITALFTVDSVGRVPLWTLGGVVMIGAQIANSVLQSMTPTTAVNNGFMAGLSIFTFAYHSTMGPLAWDICSEMFPARERGKAVGLTTMSNFIGVVLVGTVFPFAMQASPAGSFAFFTVMLFLNICLVYFYLPETAERSALQIEESFHRHQPKLLRNVFKVHHD